MFRVHGKIEIVFMRDRAYYPKVWDAEVIEDSGYCTHIAGIDWFYQDDVDII
jgi:hypothetical protein